MIESRYKIEYVLPETDNQKGKPLRVLWYLCLIPLIFLAVGLITYDFKINAFVNDSSHFLKKVTVSLLDLEQTQSLPSVQTTSKTPALIAAEKQKDKTLLLNIKQQEQYEAIQAEINKNKALSQDINDLSEKLSLEQVKNQMLNEALVAQGKNTLSQNLPLKPEEIKPQKESITVTTELLETADTSNEQNNSPALLSVTNEPKTIETPTASKEETAQTQTEKIIEEMSKQETQTSENNNTEEVIANTNDNSNNEVVDDSKEEKLNNNDKQKVSEQAVAPLKTPTANTDTNQNTISEKKASQVDSIIAAMQAAKTSDENEPNSSEKDNNQLVENAE